METATETGRARALPAFLAGMQSGLLGVLWMLAWLGMAAKWQQRSFWTSENLMASAFYGPRAIRSGFAWETISGLALYLVLYSLLGGLLAVIVRDRLPRVRTLLVSLIFAMGWYYLSFRLLWTSVLPLVALLHVERATAVGHLLYGAILARYPKYLRPAIAPKQPEPAPEPPVATPADPLQ